jgi:hypothetical protein
MDRRKFLGSAVVALGAETLSGVSNAAPLQSEPVNSLPRIRVHSDNHFLSTEDGLPFFWMGDTAWELIHHTTREEASYYLHSRSRQGFTVIQTLGKGTLGIWRFHQCSAVPGH